jgi:hypothetical protein
LQRVGYALPRTRLPLLGNPVNKARKGRGIQQPQPGERVANYVALLLLFESEPELLQEGQVIVAIPVFDYLASFDTADGNAATL